MLVKTSATDYDTKWSTFEGGGLEQYANLAGLPTTNQSQKILYVTKDTNIGYYWNTTAFVAIDSFASNITVSLPSGTFGKYSNGMTISSAGKTPQEVILDALRLAQNPTASLSFSSLIPFNSTSPQNITIAITRAIPNVGAGVKSQSLKWKNATSAFADLLDATDITTNSYIHAINNTVLGTGPPFRTGSVTYQYDFTDSQGSIGATVTKTLEIASYAAPTMSLTLSNNVPREIGDVSTSISGTVTRNSLYVPLSSTQVEYKSGINAYAIAGTAHPIENNPYPIAEFIHNPTGLITGSTYPTSITYRVQTTDSYQTSTSGLYTINFYPYIYYGGSDSILNSTNLTAGIIKGLPGKRLDTGNLSLTIYTGTTNKSFIIALPPSKKLTVVDDDTVKFPIFSEFNENIIQISNTANIIIPYNVYCMSLSEPYSPEHKFNITIASI